MLPINRHPGTRELRAFARLWFPLFVVAIGAMLWWRLDSPAAAAITWVVGLAVAGVVLASVAAARAMFVGLMIVTYPIGWVVSTIVLALMFYLVFTPLGWGMRLAGRDPLRLRARHEPSNWLPYEQDDSPERAFRQY